MGVISKLLDRLAQARNCVKDCTEKIEALPGAEVLLHQRRLAEAECKTLEGQIKVKAFHMAVRHTILGKTLQLVWNSPKRKLDQDKIEALIDQLGLNLSDYTVQPPGWWTIRTRGGG